MRFLFPGFIRAHMACQMGLSIALLTPLLCHGAEHAFGSFRIAVDADQSEYISASDYQITVENEELLLSRLTASYLGKLSNSFVADLNKDGSFEVVVTFTHTGGHETGVHLYTWSDYRLSPIKVAELDDGQRDGYQGNDQFAVADGKLLRIFQIYEQSGATWEPTAQQRRLRYSLQDNRWVAE